MGKTILTWAFGILMAFAGINHILDPELYRSFIPGWLPLYSTNYFIGVIELVLGLGLLFKSCRRPASLGLFMLMLFFLPFHLADVFRTHPAIGSVVLARIRLPLQLVLIYWAFFLIPRAR